MHSRRWLGGVLLLTAAAAAAPAGQIDTAAGTGQAGRAGDGGPAAKARLNQPFHCELGDGRLYVAEAANHCIRMVDLKTGTLTTVAGTGARGYTGDGGPATKATFNEPYAVVRDDDGKLAGLLSMPEILQYARALDIDDAVRHAWKEIQEFYDSLDIYTPG